MNIIGIAGRMGSGKDTAADVLVSKFGFVKVSLADPMKRACAEWFGWDEETLWGPSEKRNIEDPRFSRHASLLREAGVEPPFLTPRFALQQLGTEYGRRMYEDLWVDQAIKAAQFLLSGVQKTSSPPLIPTYYPWKGAVWESVCSLSRPDGDRTWVRGAQPDRVAPFGVVVPDCRFPNEVAAINAAGGHVWRLVRPDADASSTHTSETSLDTVAAKEFDRVILNTGTLADFRETIEVIGRQLFDTGLR